MTLIRQNWYDDFDDDFTPAEQMQGGQALYGGGYGVTPGGATLIFPKPKQTTTPKPKTPNTAGSSGSSGIISGFLPARSSSIPTPGGIIETKRKNTLLWIGLGALALGAVIYFATRKSSKRGKRKR